MTIAYESGSGTTTYTCDKTWKQIYDALSAGTPVVGLLHYSFYDSEMGVTDEYWESYACTKASKFTESDSGGIITGGYAVIFDGSTYDTESEDGYPSATMGG